LEGSNLQPSDRPGHRILSSHGHAKMTRFLFFFLLFPLLVLGSVVVCNPEGPTGPQDFSIFEVYGLWKLRMDSPGCAPAQVLNLEFGPYSVAHTEDSLRISGS